MATLNPDQLPVLQRPKYPPIVRRVFWSLWCWRRFCSWSRKEFESHWHLHYRNNRANPLLIIINHYWYNNGLSSWVYLWIVVKECLFEGASIQIHTHEHTNTPVHTYSRKHTYLDGPGTTCSSRLGSFTIDFSFFLWVHIFSGLLHLQPNHEIRIYIFYKRIPVIPIE